MYEPSNAALRFSLVYGPEDAPSRARSQIAWAWLECSQSVTIEVKQNHVDALSSLYRDVVFSKVGTKAQFEQYVIQPLNHRYWQMAAAGFIRFCMVGGKVNPPMRQKREAEKQLFLR